MITIQGTFIVIIAFFLGKGWAKILSKDWLSDVRRVLEVKQALEVRLGPFTSLFHLYR